MLACAIGGSAAFRPGAFRAVVHLPFHADPVLRQHLPFLCTRSTLPTAQAFFGHSPISGPVLSPHGKLLAVIAGSAGKRDALPVVDLASEQVHHTARFDDFDVGYVKWVNNERLMCDSNDAKTCSISLH